LGLGFGGRHLFASTQHGGFGVAQLLCVGIAVCDTGQFAFSLTKGATTGLEGANSGTRSVVIAGKTSRDLCDRACRFCLDCHGGRREKSCDRLR
jgi:hypothetical protein